METGRKGKGTKRHWLKRLAAVVLSLCMMAGMAVVEPVEAQAMERSEFDSKLAAIEQRYPHGSRWGEEYARGWQCFGYAHWVADQIFGGESYNWNKVYSMNNVKAGDIVQYGNPSNGYGHTIFVTFVSGNTITYTDANSDYANTVKWGQTTTKNARLYGYSFSYLQSGPGVSETPATPHGSRMETGGNRTISDGDYHIVSALTGDRFNPGSKCLTMGGLPGVKNRNGANAELWGILGDPDHVFTVKWLGNGFYKIKLKSSDNKCLDVDNAGTAEGTNVQQWEDNGTDAQQWVISERDDGIGYTLQARCSGYYLDVDNGNTANGTNIRMWSGNGTMAQRWYFVPWGGGSSARQEIENGEYYISPQSAANMTLNAEGNGTTDETNIIIWPSLQDRRHTFKVSYLGNGYYELINSNSNLALDVSGGWSKNETNVQLYRRLNENNKKWLIKPCGDGSYYIISKCNGLYLDLYSGSTAQGTNVHLWVGHGSPTQKWLFKKYIEKVDAKSVSLNKRSLTLETGGQAVLAAMISPANASDQTLTWKSSKPAVAAVDSNGVVTAKSAGKATITVKTSNGKTAMCQVTVKKKTAEKVDVKSVSLNKSSLTLKAGEQATLTATVSPTNATNQTLIWKSNKSAVAAVDSNGIVTARSAGTATITVRTLNGKTATCKVIVEAKTDGNIDYDTGDDTDYDTGDDTDYDTDDDVDYDTDDETADCTHSYRKTVTPATMEADGSIVEECRKCGDEKSRIVIPAIDTVILSKTRFLYNGKEQEPEVTVEDNEGGTLTEGEDYTVSVDGDEKKVGRYTVVVEFEGNYEGEVERAFDIIPKGTAITELTAEKNGFRMSWKKRTSQTTGYEIAYSTSPRFTKATTKTVLVKKNKTTSQSVSKLKPGKKYYVRIRTYKTVKFAGETIKIYSGWSEKRTVVTKK